MAFDMSSMTFFWSKPKRKRELLEGEKIPFVTNDENFSKNSRSIALRDFSTVGAIVFWQVIAICFAVLSLLLFLAILPFRAGGFEHGFPTEIDAAKAIFSTHEVAFDGGPSFYDNGTEYLRPSRGKKYIGEPTQEIDDNWTELTKGRWFLLTEDEARKAWGNEYKDFWNEFAGGYIATVDAMHMIHCLDHIRKSFYPKYYEEQDGVYGALHRDHCIDSLRQILMCKADLTPLPSRWYPNVLPGIHYIDSDRPHTCRDWAAVRGWITSRSIGADTVQPRHSPGHEEDWRDY